MLAALATTMGFTSCDEAKDDHPVLTPNDGVVVENFLNTPEMSNMAVEFTEDNKTDYLHMTCSQPSYGYAAMVCYQVEVSLSPDFSTAVIEGLPVTATLSTPFYDCSEINPSYGELATAMSDLLGITNEKELPTGYYDIYARLIANIQTANNDNYPNTTYHSNIVKLTRANCTYLAIVIPGLQTGIYLRGGMNNWGDEIKDSEGNVTTTKEELLAPWEFLTTDVANVYEIASCSIDKDTEFKVADATWGTINCGLGSDPFEVGKPYTLNGGDNPGNLVMPQNFSGRVQLTKAGDTYTVLFEADEPDEPGNPSGIYLRGDMNGWDTSAQFLTTDFKNNWLIQGVSIADGQGFKIADADWGTINLGLEPGSTVEAGKTYNLVSGGDNITMSGAFNGDIKLKLQGGVYKMTLVAL